MHPPAPRVLPPAQDSLVVSRHQGLRCTTRLEQAIRISQEACCGKLDLHQTVPGVPNLLCLRSGGKPLKVRSGGNPLILKGSRGATAAPRRLGKHTGLTMASAPRRAVHLTRKQATRVKRGFTKRVTPAPTRAARKVCASVLDGPCDTQSMGRDMGASAGEAPRGVGEARQGTGKDGYAKRR